MSDECPCIPCQAAASAIAIAEVAEARPDFKESGVFVSAAFAAFLRKLAKLGCERKRDEPESAGFN